MTAAADEVQNIHFEWSAAERDVENEREAANVDGLIYQETVLLVRNHSLSTLHIWSWRFIVHSFLNVLEVNHILGQSQGGLAKPSLRLLQVFALTNPLHKFIFLNFSR